MLFFDHIRVVTLVIIILGLFYRFIPSYAKKVDRFRLRDLCNRLLPLL